MDYDGNIHFYLHVWKPIFVRRASYFGSLLQLRLSESLSPVRIETDAKKVLLASMPKLWMRIDMRRNGMGSPVSNLLQQTNHVMKTWHGIRTGYENLEAINIFKIL